MNDSGTDTIIYVTGACTLYLYCALVVVRVLYSLQDRSQRTTYFVYAKKFNQS